MIRDLGLDKPAQDITLLSADELTAQLRDLTKQLLSYGVRMPKELMLFVKDLLFLDGAVATMAPEIDLLGEVAVIAAYFAQHHGERIAAEVGVDVRSTPVDLDGLRASMGLVERHPRDHLPGGPAAARDPPPEVRRQAGDRARLQPLVARHSREAPTLSPSGPR